MYKIVSSNRVAACSNCLHISLVSFSVCATIAPTATNSSLQRQSSRVFVFAFSLANWNNCSRSSSDETCIRSVAT